MTQFWKWLDETKNWWAVAALGGGVYSFYHAIAQNRWTIGGFPRPSLIAAVAGIIFAVAYFAGQRWSRWICVAWIALLAIVQVVNSAVTGWSRWDLAVFVLLALMGVYCYYLFFREEESDEGQQDKPFLSLVLLLREPNYLDATILASLASRAWGMDVHGSGLSDSDNDQHEEQSSADGKHAFVVGESPLFIASHPSALFVIHHRDQPYWEDADALAEQIVEVRGRKSVRDHGAWLSVDALQFRGEGDETEQCYRLIARLLAELADDNVLAVVDPDAGRIFCYDPETEQKLRSENPLAALRQWYYSPILQVDSDDPEMQAAVAEAQQRWPEFVAAFESRDPEADVPFIVKAPFGGEHCEFMWVEVSGIENEVIYGTLKNEPAAIPDLHEGDRVKTAVADVNDWLAVIDGQPVGGFTLKVIAGRARQGRPADDKSDS